MKEIDLILVSETYDPDEIGQRIPIESRRTVPAHEDSVTRNEWNAAGQNGIKAEKVVYTSTINYEGEEIAIINDVRYIIYRTYNGPSYGRHSITEDEIELYLRKEVD